MQWCSVLQSVLDYSGGFSWDEASGFLQNLFCELDIKWKASACQRVLKSSSKLCCFNASFVVWVCFFSYHLEFVAGLRVQQNACQTSRTAERQGKHVLWTLTERNLEGESWKWLESFHSKSIDLNRKISRWQATTPDVWHADELPFPDAFCPVLSSCRGWR